jgi:hypothetical protein
MVEDSAQFTTFDPVFNSKANKRVIQDIKFFNHVQRTFTPGICIL